MIWRADDPSSVNGSLSSSELKSGERDGERVNKLEKDGRIIGWRVYLVPWVFTKRPLAVKNPLMMICFWEFHWLSVEACWRCTKRRGVASLNSRGYRKLPSSRHSLYLILSHSRTHTTTPSPFISWQTLVPAVITLILRSGL